jgi:Right handed beta helix region
MKKFIALAAVVSGGLLAVAGVAQADPTCVTTPMGLTAAVNGGPVTGDVNATGCDIGVYNPTSTAGADIHGAKYYGVVVDGGTTSVTGATVHDIGDNPLDGNQYGVGIYATGGAHGTITHNTVSEYQKGGIVVKEQGTDVAVTDNTVTGLDKVNFIAQNGIQVSNGATATVTGNKVSDNFYSGKGWTSTGILFYGAGTTPKVGAIRAANILVNNQQDVRVVK